MLLKNVSSGLVPQGQKASDYDNSDPVPPRQNVVPTVEKTDSSQQGLEFLFSPLLEEYYNPYHTVLAATEGKTTMIKHRMHHFKKMIFSILFVQGTRNWNEGIDFDRIFCSSSPRLEAVRIFVAQQAHKSNGGDGNLNPDSNAQLQSTKQYMKHVGQRHKMQDGKAIRDNVKGSKSSSAKNEEPFTTDNDRNKDKNT
ncbi:hypothetical protein Tco_1054825 [Tanacetum coccineum]|uniref:Uncharacterized protein n=1 Tax=Tanacetum coccineum TaxID=301880 RepID=A0ABQ5H0A1_9ASTR